MSQTEVQLIKDAVIVNADVSNSAAIDVSKISGALPAAGGTITGDVTFTGANVNIVFDKSDNALEFGNDAKAKFGADTDLEIHHQSSDDTNLINSHKELKIYSNGNTSLNTNNADVMVKAVKNGTVELYYDNVKKFETTSTGVLVSGSLTADGGNAITLGDSKKIVLGTGSDLEIFHNGNHSFINDSGTGNLFVKTSKLAVENAAGNEALLSATQDGSVELYHDGTKKLETSSTGATLSGNLSIDANVIHNGDTDTMLSFSADNQVDIQCASTLIGRFTTNGLAVGDNKRLDILDASGHRSGVIDNCDSGANSLRLSADPDNSGSGSYMIFAVDGTEQARIANGISFNGDTASANFLNDYEEGTFTPTSSAVTLTGTIAGHYTKIGDLVTVQMIFVVPSTSNTSDIEIDGLPFNGKNGTDGSYIQGGFVTYHNQGGGPYTALIANNMNRIVVYKADGNRQTFDQFSGKNLRLAAVYKVA